MRKIYAPLLALVFAFLCINSSAQVSLTASTGIPAGSFTTLKAAFDAINLGKHTGNIVISLNASTFEGTTPASLNSSDADPGSYTSVIIRPTADNITVQGNPAQGFAVIQFNGSDNVIIDGDNPNSAGINRNLTVLNTASNTIQFSSVIRIATSPNVPSADNITVKNCILNGNVTGGNASGFSPSNDNTFGIYAGGNGGATLLDDPVAITNVTGDNAKTGTTINNLVIENNQLNQCGRAIVFNGEVSAVNNLLTISNNDIGTTAALGAYPYTAPATTVYSKGIWISGSNSAAITLNRIRNIIQYGNFNLSAIELSAAIGVGSVSISNNTVSGVVNNGTSDARGIFINSIGADYTVSGNDISLIESSGATTSGLQLGAGTAPGLIEKNRIYNVFARNIGGATGINMATVANNMVVQNNFIYDIKNNLGQNFNLNRGVNGILVNSGSNHKIYHNSIHLYHTSTANTSNYVSCLTINNSSQTGIDIRNNIFVNTVTGGAASNAHVALYFPFTVSASMNLTLNNNAYYVGSILNTSGIALTGTTAYNASNIYTAAAFDPTVTTPAGNWRSFSSALGVATNDNASIALTTGHPFISNTNLHVANGASPSPLESGGAVIGVLTDIDGDARPGPAGSVNGGGALPDIGADEFDRQLEDKFPPVITFNPPVTCGVGPRLVDALITDATGVPTTGPGMPVLYWRIAPAGPWNPNTATFSGGLYHFVIDIFSTAPLGSTVQYYIVAQDIVATPNIIASPSTGASGYTANPPAAATPPSSFHSYTVINALGGTYNVGAGQTYTTLTAAVNDYNVSCLSGPVVFNLVDANYNSETFPITINANASASSTNTLTIKPAATATISGNNGSALIKFNGADYVRIDGSNNGTSSRDLTLVNTNANTSAAVIWIASASASDGATNNIIRNTNITGSGTSTTIAGIVAGSGTTLGTSAEAQNNNNLINNCVFKSFQNGIYINGKIVFAQQDINWTISNNIFGSSVASEKMGYRGLSLQNVAGYTISGNTIAGVTLPSGSAAISTGISIFGNATGGAIYSNQISDVKHLGTSGSNGIFLGSGTGSATNIYNNFIWDIASAGTSGVLSSSNGYGIMVNSGGGYNIYNNSVLMGTTQSNSTGTTAAINISSGVTAPNSLNIRNNIFANTQTSGTRYAIYSGAAATVFQDINYNDYYVSPSTTLGFLGSARSNLSAWQLATGKDANSVSANPLFISASNLHLQNISPLNALATPIGIVSVDIDGNTRNATTPDIGADEFTAPNCSGTPTGGTAAVSSANICGTGVATLSASGYSLGEGLTYQWQYSIVSATGPWTNVTGQTNPASASTGTINQTTYFQLFVSCSFSGPSTGISTPVTVTVNNPTVTGTTPGSRCGPGTVSLAATPSAGAALNWYEAATGGSPIATGSPFTTPVISSTTTYYVSAQSNPPIYIPSDVSAYNFSTSTGAALDPMSGSVEIVPANVDDQPGLVNNIGFNFNFSNTDYSQFSASPDGWIMLGGGTAISQFTNSIVSTVNTPKIYPFWDDHATGSNGSVRYVLTGSAPNRILKVQWIVRMPRTPLTDPSNTTFQAWLYEGSNKIEFRYGAMAAISTSASVGLTASATSFQSVTVTSNTSSNSVANNSVTDQPAIGRMYVFSPALCESGRTPVTATVSAPPAMSPATATPATICVGESSTLAVTPSDPNYSYSWTPGPLAGASVVVSPVATTTYTVTGTYLTGPSTGCTNVSEVTVTVNELPGAVFVTPATVTICAGGNTVLNATGGTVAGNASFTSGTINLSIPDESATGASNSLAVSGIPAGATIDSVIITANITFPTFASDVIASIEAPNGQILNLISGQSIAGFGGSNFTNTRFSSDPSKPALNSSSAPFTGTFRPDAATTFQLTPNPVPTTTTFSSLFGIPNGNWIFRAYDDEGIGTGSISSWQIKIAYTASAVFTWLPNNGSLNTVTGPTVIASPTTTTTYTATATNGLGCKRSATSVVTVNTATASVTIAANPGNVVCAGTSVTFTATAVQGGTTPSYQWYIGATPVGTNSNTFTTSSLANGDVVTVQLTSNAPCVVGNPFTSNAITMTVNPTVAAGVSIAANPGNTICAGASVTFTATPVNGGGAPVYQWYVGATPVGTNSNTYTTTTLVNGDVVTVRMTSNASCVTGSPVTSSGITMTVNPNVAASVTITGNNCSAPGNPIVFTATTVNAGPSYQWYVGGVLQSETSNTFTYLLPVNGTQVQAFMTSTTPCSLPSPAPSNIIVVSFTTPPSATATASCTNIFAGGLQNVLLDASTSTAGSGTITGYQWNLGGVPIGGATSVTYTTNAAGSYTVSVTNSNGCTTTSAPVIITALAAGPLAAGTYTIPGTTCASFPNIANAVTYVNANGISGTGGVIFNIASGYTETAPAGGYRITATGTAANGITFQRSGAVNPVITSTPGAAGSVTDALFKLVGSDYITIRNLTLQEHAVTPNLTSGTNNMTEFGVALLQQSLINGSQNNLVEGNTISLNRNYSNSFGIYSNASHLEVSPNTVSIAASGLGSNNNNRVYSNTITDVNNPVVFIGSTLYFDADNQVGGATPISGNTITNWGGQAAAYAYANLPAATTTGILVSNQVGESVTYNKLTSAALTGVAVAIRGIHKIYSISPVTGTFTSSLSNNVMTLTGAFTTGTEFTGIKNESITPVLATATININGNKLLNCTVSGGAPLMTGILHNSLPGAININNDTISGFTSTVTSAFVGFNVTGATTVDRSITNNLINGVSCAGPLTGMSIAAGTTSCLVQTNIVSGLTTSANSALAGISLLSGAGVANFLSNTITGLTGSGQVNGFSVTGGTNATFDNNTVQNLSTLSGTAFVTGMQVGNVSVTITNNIFNNLSIASTVPNNASVYGILQGSAAGNTVTIIGNTFSNIYSNSVNGNATIGLVNGIYQAGASSAVISKNRIFDLAHSATSATTTVNGILIINGANININNNFISDLKNPNSSNPEAVRGIAMPVATAGANFNLYFNTIYLKAAASTGPFGSSGISHLASGTATSGQLTMINNIIVNESTPIGTGLTVALRRIGTATGNYNVASNNNVFYAGTSGPNNLLYYDGTSSVQTLAALQTALTPREASSYAYRPVFINIAITPYNLHLNTASNCAISGAGIPVAGITQDIDNDIRNTTNPDIGADEFNPTGGGPVTWKGVNTDWNDVNNWCPSVPTATTDVTIPNGAAFYPVITTATPVARDIIIGSTANIQIAAAGTLSVNGVFNSAGTITNNGKILMQGTSNQFFPGTTATVAAMNVFEINKPSGNVTIDGNFRLTGEFLPTSGTVTMDGTVTIASTAASTARIGVVGTSNAFIYNGTGSFIVERYINTGIGAGQHAKSWQLLGSPTRTETVNAWQDGNLPMGNLRPGFGTIVTGTAAGQGFDIITPAGSTVKWWNAVPATPLWVDIPNVNVPVYDKRGYMVFVRGDRSVTTSVASPNPTTLRTRGAIFAPGTNAPPSSTVLAGKFESVANPYASAITYTALSLTNVDANKFYVWDPLLAGAYGLGGFQTIQGPTWLPVPGGTTTYPSATPVTTIQSGQVFFVFNSTGTPGTVGFSEAAKTTGSSMVFRGNETIMSLSASLYAGNNMADGNLVVFDQAYADGVDMNDAIKQANFGENFGIVKETRKLSIESRSPVTHTDTVFYNIASLKQQEYLLKFAPANLNTPGLSAYLVDRFTARHTDISLTDSTVVPIAVTAEAGSSAADRFLLVFKKIPSVSFLQLNAVKEGEEVKVSWDVKDEVNIAHYEIERSSNGTDFGKTGEQSAVNTGLASYTKMDRDPLTGDNHYRIRSVSVTGEVRYSNIAKVRFTPAPAAITVHPNPMKEDKLLNISMVNKPAGRYIVRLMTSNGTTVYTDLVEHQGRTGNYALRIRSFLAHGTYMLSIGTEEGNAQIFKIVY